MIWDNTGLNFSTIFKKRKKKKKRVSYRNMIAVQMSFIYAPRNVTIGQIKHAALSAV